MSGWDYATYRDELDKTESRLANTDDSALTDWYSAVKSVLVEWRDISYDPENVDQAWLDRSRNQLVDAVAQAELSLEDVTSGAYMQRQRDQLAQLFEDAGVSGLSGLYVALDDNLDILRAIEDQYGIQGRLIDEAGNIQQDIADTLQFSLDEIESFRTNFQAAFEQGFADAMGIDTEGVGSQFQNVANKYASAAYSDTERLSIELESLAARLAEFSDLDISKDTSISDFRSAFEAVQGSVDGETLGRWWAAADAVGDYSNAQQELNELLSNGAGTLDSTTTGMVESIWSDYQSSIDLINESYDTRLQQLKDEQDFIASLQRAVDRLALSDLSPLTPQQREDEAERQWSEIMGQISAGDYSNADQLASAGEAWIKEAQSMWGSGQQAIDVYNTVAGALNDLQASFDDDSYEDRVLALNTARNAELGAQKQLLQSQLSTLVSANATLSSMDDLLKALPDQLADNLRNVVSSVSPPVVENYAPDAGRATIRPVTVIPLPVSTNQNTDTETAELRVEIRKMSRTLSGLMTDQITATERQTGEVTGAVSRSSNRRQAVEMNR